MRWAAIGSTILLVVMIGLALFASSQRADAVAQRDVAENERRIAFVRELSVNAVSNLDVDPERSILLALQAVSVKFSRWQARSARSGRSIASRGRYIARATHAARSYRYGQLQSLSAPMENGWRQPSHDMTAKVWDAATGKELLTLTGHTASRHRMWRLARMARGWQLQARTKQPKCGTRRRAKSCSRSLAIRTSFSSVAFSPDGTRVATSSGKSGTSSVDHTAKVWDATTGKELFTLTGHTGGVINVTFSPDGKLLATGSEDNTAKIWDAATGKALLTLTGHTDEVHSVAFSPNGRRLVTGGYTDRTAKIWDTTSGQLLMTLFNTSTVTARFIRLWGNALGYRQ